MVADYRKFVAKVHEALPKTDVVFLPIKPSISRWKLWPEMDKANQAIRKLTEANRKLHYLPIPPAMLGEDGKPMKKHFVKDNLHLSEEGYELWSGFVKNWLEKQP